MKVVYEYSHLGGSEILQVRYPDVNNEIAAIIGNVDTRKTKFSKEKTVPGRELYSPKEMNAQFHKAFDQRGYKQLRDTYTNKNTKLSP